LTCSFPSSFPPPPGESLSSSFCPGQLRLISLFSSLLFFFPYVSNKFHQKKTVHPMLPFLALVCLISPSRQIWIVRRGKASPGLYRKCGRLSRGSPSSCIGPGKHCCLRSLHQFSFSPPSAPLFHSSRWPPFPPPVREGLEVSLVVFCFFPVLRVGLKVSLESLGSFSSPSFQTR